jgi:glycosyltransferase involved in cell wall biosynthesis
MNQHTLFYGSSYDRGLERLLFLWPRILEKFPDAKLHVAYGWDLFDAAFRNNPERMAWKERVAYLLEQKGVVHHGRLGKKELSAVRRECGIWVYPTHFEEINCITALECQLSGLIPVVSNFAALKETVPFFRVGDDKLLEVMALPEKDLNALQKQVVSFASTYSWDKIATKWLQEFDK